MRTIPVLTVGGLVGALLPALLVAPLAGPAQAADVTLTWCTDPSPSPVCIVSASQGGAAITPSDPTWDVSGVAYEVAGARQVSVSLMRDGDYDLGSASLGDEMSVTLQLSDRIPRVVSGKGRDVTVSRTTSTPYVVTVTGLPVTVSGQCDQSSWPWVCPEATETSDPELQKQWDATFDMLLSDFGQWDDKAQRLAFFGMDFFTNIAATGIPPTIVYDDAGVGSIVIDMANRHYLADGVTAVSGRAELRIPHAFLSEVYGITEPESLTPEGLTVRIGGGGTATVTQDVSGDAVLVVVDGVTFSTRKLRVERGSIAPTRPRDLRARRVAAGKGVLRFEESVSRGATVKRYLARCETRGHTVKVRDGDNRVVVRRLRSGRAYTCQVRALSDAGRSKWSAPARMKARP